MEEEKKTTKKVSTKKATKTTGKKETTTGKKVVSKSTTKKASPSASKKTETVKGKTETKKTPAKTATKKTTTGTTKTASSKNSVKKTSVKKAPAKTPKKVEIEKEENILERTIIFDGEQSKNIKEVVKNEEEGNVIVEDKIIKRSKVRKAIIILLYLAIIGVIAATVLYIINDKKEKDKNNETVNSNIAEKVIKNYGTKEIDKDKIEDDDTYANIINIGLNTLEQKAKDKDDIHVLIASSTCVACALFEKTIQEAYEEKNIKIYRIDIHNLTDEETTRLRTYYAFRSTPTVFSLKDGVVVSDLVGNRTKEELINWIEEN